MNKVYYQRLNEIIEQALGEAKTKEDAQICRGIKMHLLTSEGFSLHHASDAGGFKTLNQARHAQQIFKKSLNACYKMDYDGESLWTGDIAKRISEQAFRGYRCVFDFKDISSPLISAQPTMKGRVATMARARIIKDLRQKAHDKVASQLYKDVKFTGYIRVQAYYPDYRVRDDFNYAYRCKAIVDGMVDAHLMDDRWVNFSRGSTAIGYLDKDLPRVVVDMF